MLTVKTGQTGCLPRLIGVFAGHRAQSRWLCDTAADIILLAHLSQRLICELIGYPWSGVRTSSVVNNFKHLLLQNRLPDQSQILCGASLGRGNESLFAASGSHDQDGRHTHIWKKKTSKIFSRTHGRFS